MKNTEATATEANAIVAPQGAHVAPETKKAKKGTTRKKGAHKAKKGAKVAKATKPAAKGSGPRPESKGAKILELLARPKGATLAELMKQAGWQAHSVRGFISTAGKKHNVQIESSKNDSGDRVYKITK